MNFYIQYIYYLPTATEKASAKWRNRSQPDGVDPFARLKIANKKPDRAIG